MDGPRCGLTGLRNRQGLGTVLLTITAIPAAVLRRRWDDMRTIKELGPATHWRALAHRHGSNLIGGVMVTVMLYGILLAVLAS